jgi:thiol-disulfide isomerase/thioredoxin
MPEPDLEQEEDKRVLSLRMGEAMPSFDGATGWLGGTATRDDLLGAPVVVHFWSVSCVFCKENMPRVSRWPEKYASLGLRVVNVHLPRTEEDRDLAVVEETARQHGLTGPCAIDGERAITERFRTKGLLPHYFLFEADGGMRSRAVGMRGVRLIELALDHMDPNWAPPAPGSAEEWTQSRIVEQ